MKHLKLVFISFLFVSIGMQAQSLRVQGTVISTDDRQPMIGASVVVKGTSSGTITDLDGRYALDVDANATLQFSYIGYETVEEPVQNRRTINASLVLKTNMLQEVVMMGYSSQKKAELSSAVVTLDAEQLTDVMSSDLGTMLQGKVAGLMVSNASGQPGSTSELRIRGTGSIAAEAKPLFVVDGIPGGSYNPNDIETVTVLKDAGATAIYGADGAGGVIVITTKQGKRNQPTQINFKANYGQKHVLQGKFEMMNGAELYDMHKMVFSPTLFAMQRPAELRDRDFDWLGAAFHTGHLQNYYVSAAGASDKVNYFASLDYYQEDGTLMSTNYDRVTSRVNLNAKLTEKIDLNVRMSYNKSNNRETSSYIVLEGAYRNIPWDNPYDDENNYVKIDAATRPDNGKPWYTQDRRNFLHGEQYNFAKSRSEGFTGDFQLNWNLYDWLIFTTTNRLSSGGYNYKQFIDPRTFDPNWSNGYARNNIGQWGSFGTTNLLKFNKSIEEHSINGLIGYEWGKSYNDYSSAEGVGMPNGVDGLGGAIPQGIDGYFYETAGYSWFAQVQYNYLSRYFLTGSFRADTSSRFAKNNRTGYFPGATAAWLISNEDFLAGNDLLTFMKLRGSYGVTGNSNIATFQSLAVYDLSTSYEDRVGAVLLREENPNLTWESAHMGGVGLDLSFWNRLHLSFDVYNLENRDLLLNVPRSPSTGFEVGLENIGRIRNRGLEIQLNSDNIKTKDFLWNSNFNISFNQNRVTSLPDGKPVLFRAGNSSVIQEAREGQDLNSWFLPKWLGVDPDNGDPLWEEIIRDPVDGSEISRGKTNDINKAESQVVGKATPKFTGSLINTFSYKGLSLYANLYFVYGNDVYNRDREYTDNDGAYLGYNMMKLQDGWSRWENPGDNATHPRPVMNGNKASNNTSSRYLEDGSFLRLKNVTLSYNLPKKWMDPIKMQSCRVYVSGDNLLTFTNFSGLDPEVSLSRTEWSLAGMYSFNYPISRQFLIGFDITF